ncbi:MAG: chromate resistance protein [Siculibacillus sp.]|nr:chromate resistance protein [Siculibacillus sp.]
MPSNTEISVARLARLVGTPAAPSIVDVRLDDDVASDPRSLPAADHRDPQAVATWAQLCAGRQVVVSCQKGGKLAQGTAARLRADGIRAETLEGGFEAWRDAGALLVDRSALPPRDADGRTVWVTRARPKIDRIACPWLIRRFVDPRAVFLYVDAAEVPAVAEVFGAAPFDIDGAFWSHRDERCTFDTMLEEFGLASEALARLATIVRGADTDRHDLEQLDASMALYDALYRWCRDAVEETHDWPADRARR